jgi:hypothetical protein
MIWRKVRIAGRTVSFIVAAVAILEEFRDPKREGMGFQCMNWRLDEVRGKGV